MGYVNFTVGIGWSIGSIIAGHLYEKNGDKVLLARRYLKDVEGIAAKTVDDIPKSKLLSFFEKTVDVDAWQTRQILWDTYHPESMWLIFTLIGVASMVAIIAYNFVVKSAAANPQHSFNTQGELWVRVFLIPICLLILAASMYEAYTSDPSTFTAFGYLVKLYLPSPGLALNTAFFWLMLVVSFIGAPKKTEMPKKGDGTSLEDGTGLYDDEVVDGS